jgi:hypothetical protein
MVRRQVNSVDLTRERKLKGAPGRVEAVNGQVHSPLDTAVRVLCGLCENRQKSAFKGGLWLMD